MKTIRLEGMTDAEYKLITQSECPYCSSRDTARTNYSNVHPTFRNVDITCDSCGGSWSISEQTGPIRQLQLSNDTVRANKSHFNESKADLSRLSDNKLRHMRKSELVLLAERCGLIGEGMISGMTKPQLVSALIRKREEQL